MGFFSLAPRCLLFFTGSYRVTAPTDNRFDSGTLLASATWRAPLAIKTRLQQEVFHKAQGVPGIGAVPARTANTTADRARSVLALERAATATWPGARLEASISGLGDGWDVAERGRALWPGQ